MKVETRIETIGYVPRRVRRAIWKLGRGNRKLRMGRAPWRLVDRKMCEQLAKAGFRVPKGSIGPKGNRVFPRQEG